MDSFGGRWGDYRRKYGDEWKQQQPPPPSQPQMEGLRLLQPPLQAFAGAAQNQHMMWAGCRMMMTAQLWQHQQHQMIQKQREEIEKLKAGQDHTSSPEPQE